MFSIVFLGQRFLSCCFNIWKIIHLCSIHPRVGKMMWNVCCFQNVVLIIHIGSKATVLGINIAILELFYYSFCHVNRCFTNIAKHSGWLNPSLRWLPQPWRRWEEIQDQHRKDDFGLWQISHVFIFITRPYSNPMRVINPFGRTVEPANELIWVEWPALKTRRRSAIKCHCFSLNHICDSWLPFHVSSFAGQRGVLTMLTGHRNHKSDTCSAVVGMLVFPKQPVYAVCAYIDPQTSFSTAPARNNGPSTNPAANGETTRG